MKSLVWVFFALCTFLLGFYVTQYGHRTATLSDIRPTCRPSNPTLFVGQPTVLFWGNSLAFDNDWHLDGILSVNCAVQGLTAQAAVDRTTALPDMDFTAVVIVFGTVELVRNFDDPVAFEANINKITFELKQNYPGAALIALGIAHHSTSPSVWAYEQQPHLDALNRILQRLEGVTVIDTGQTLEEMPRGTETYDGVHFSHQSYRLLEDAIQEELKAYLISNS